MIEIKIEKTGQTGPPGTTTWAGITDKPTEFPPSGHASTHALGEDDEITPASIGAVDISRVVAVAINVKDYGAIGDGINNDSVAVQNAINAAGAAEKAVYFPRGIYKCNIVLGATDATKSIQLFGAGNGNVSDWTAVSTPLAATQLIPNDNALPIIKIVALAGIKLQDFEMRGNGAGTTTNGLHIIPASGIYTGAGLILENVNIRRCTYNINSDGPTNVIIRASGLFEGNYGLYIPSRSLAHTYTLDGCSIGGTPATGTGRCFHIEDGSVLNIINCEQGNCTDYLYMGGSGSPQVNIFGGNWETFSSTVLINMLAGKLTVTGGRVAVDNVTFARVNGTDATIGGVILNGVALSGLNMIAFETNGWNRPIIRGVGFGAKIKVWSSDFTSLIGESINERLLSVARFVADQVMASAGTYVVIPAHIEFNVGSKYSTSTGRFTPGKAGYYRITASLRVSTIGAFTLMRCFVNGANRWSFQGLTSGGSGTMLSGSCVVYLDADDYADIRLEVPGACNVMYVDNFTSQIAFEEIDYH